MDGMGARPCTLYSFEWAPVNESYTKLRLGTVGFVISKVDKKFAL